MYGLREYTELTFVHRYSLHIGSHDQDTTHHSPTSFLHTNYCSLPYFLSPFLRSSSTTNQPSPHNSTSQLSFPFIHSHDNDDRYGTYSDQGWKKKKRISRSNYISSVILYCVIYLYKKCGWSWIYYYGMCGNSCVSRCSEEAPGYLGAAAVEGTCYPSSGLFIFVYGTVFLE